MLMRNKEVELDIDISVEEFVLLDMKLNKIIDTWTKVEVGDGIGENSKLSELAVFNFKMIYSSDKVATEFLNFMLNTKEATRSSDKVMSRIQDLYVYLCMSFPKAYVEFQRASHKRSLQELGYTVVESLENKIQIGWLMHRIQQSIRYINPIEESKRG